MHPAEIKAALTIAGYKQTDAAKACGVAATTIGAVINGRSRSKAVEEWVSAVTGLALAKLWPARYGGTQLVLTQAEQELIASYRALPGPRQLELLAVMKREALITTDGSGN